MSCLIDHRLSLLHTEDLVATVIAIHSFGLTVLGRHCQRITYSSIPRNNYWYEHQ